MPLSLAVLISVYMKAAPVAAALGAGEEPRLSPQSRAAQLALGGIVRQAVRPPSRVRRPSAED
jgi:hypothetical protein